MPAFVSPRERRLWLGAASCLLAIYATIYPGQFWLDALRGRGLLRLSILLAFTLAGGGLLLWAARRRPGWREWTVLAASLAAYIPFVTGLPVLQERLHFLEYGVLAGLCEAALRERWHVLRPPAELRRASLATGPLAGALALTAAAGWVDEIIQAFVPHRVYDSRDVALNTFAGLLALAVLAARRAARARDAAAALARA